MEDTLIQYGVAGVAIIGLSIAVKVLYTDNKELREQIIEIVTEQTRSDNNKFRTLQEALRVIKELRKER